MLRLAFASCQHYERGYFAAWRHLVADDPELVLFLGDYIYESNLHRNPVRRHWNGEPKTLADYRLRHGNDPIAPKADLTIAENFFHMCFGSVPEPEVVGVRIPLQHEEIERHVLGRVGGPVGKKMKQHRVRGFAITHPRALNHLRKGVGTIIRSS